MKTPLIAISLNNEHRTALNRVHAKTTFIEQAVKLAAQDPTRLIPAFERRNRRFALAMRHLAAHGGAVEALTDTARLGTSIRASAGFKDHLESLAQALNAPKAEALSLALDAHFIANGVQGWVGDPELVTLTELTPGSDPGNHPNTPEEGAAA